MSEILQHLAIPTLEEMEVPYLLDPRADAIVVPYESPDGGRFLLRLLANDELQEAMVATEIVHVPKSRRERIALLLAGLNATSAFVKFGMIGGAVRADVGIELTNTSDSHALLRLGFNRLVFALNELAPRILRAAQSAKRRPRVLREAEEIVKRLDYKDDLEPPTFDSAL